MNESATPSPSDLRIQAITSYILAGSYSMLFIFGVISLILLMKREMRRWTIQKVFFILLILTSAGLPSNKNKRTFFVPFKNKFCSIDTKKNSFFSETYLLVHRTESSVAQ